jgi:cytochrome bd ubiquinol oxidase subunit I
MRTADSVSPSLTGGNVLLSLLLYVAVYLMIYPVGVSVMLRVVRKGPAASEEDLPIESGHPKRPIEALAGTTPAGAR